MSDTQPLGKQNAMTRMWSAYFFPTTSPVRLGVLRIILVAAQLAFFRESLRDHRAFLARDAFIDPMLLTRLLLKVFPEQTLRDGVFIDSLWWVTCLAGVLALVGLCSRTSIFIFGLGNLLLASLRYSYGHVSHPEAIYCTLLMLSAFAPIGRCYSIDSWLHRRKGHPGWGPRATTDMAMWPILLGQWLLTIAYLQAFFSKIMVGGMYWINGYTLQQYLLTKGLRNDRPLGVWFAQQPREFFIALAVGSLLFEGTFLIIMFDRFKLVRRLRPLYLLGGVGFHTGIYVTLSAAFPQFVLMYLLWFPFESYRAKLKRDKHQSASVGVLQ